MSERSRSGGGLQGAVAWFSLLVVLGLAIALGGNREVFWLPVSCALLGALALQLLMDVSGRSSGSMARQAMLPGLLFVAVLGWALFQSIPVQIADWAHPAWQAVAEPGAISAAPFQTEMGILRLAAYGAVFWIATRAAENTVRASRMIDLIALFSTALAAYGLIAWGAELNPVTGEPAYPGVVTATFINRNAYALYAAFGAMACITALAMRLPDQASEGLARSVAKREMVETLTRTAWIFSLGALLCIIAMLLTGSRAGSIAGLAGIALVLWSMVGRHLGTGYAVAALLLLVLIPGAAVPLLLERLGGLNLFEDQRVHLYTLVYGGLADRPWLGHGLGAFQDTFRPYMDETLGTQEWDHAHSSYLENAWELGIPGAAALVLVPVLLLVGIAAGLARRRRMRPALILAIGAGLAAGLHGAVDFSMEMPATAALFSMMLGLAWGLASRPKAREAESLED